MLENATLTVSVLDGGITPLLPLHRDGWRLLPFHVLVCNCNVRGRVQQNEMDYIAGDREAYLIRRNIRHNLYWIDGEEPTSVWCHFNVMLFHSIDLLSFYEIPPKFTGSLAAALREKCVELVGCGRENISDVFRREVLAHELISLILSGCAEKPDAAEMLASVGRLTPALDYMKSHLSAEFELAHAAAAVSLSPSRFAALFKAAFGVSPGEYWRHLRLTRAYEMLYKEESPPKETAGILGFYDEFHFARAFQKKFGITPAALLRQIKKQGRW